MNLELSTLKVASAILQEMSKNKILKYDALFGKLSTKIGDDIKFNFHNALSLLYLLGKIEYHKKTDSFEFNK
jgi:anionic cell wall polymer biosynthesis LytR-Cps2A-Psr (LCP) family protein